MPSASQLITLNLRYGSHARPLKTLAFADLAVNSLFFIGREATTEEVAKEVARLLGLPQVEPRTVATALDFLAREKKVHNRSGKWQLADETLKTLQTATSDADRAIDAVLSRHFPGSIERPTLQKWFLEASSDFFGFNGGEWVKSIAKGNAGRFAKPQSIRDLLQPSLTKYKFQEHADILIDAYDAFLSSENADDLKYVMDLGFAMFSARLVSAETGADPITVEEIRGATFVLDTNALFPIQLDAHRLGRSIRALALALADIGAELVYLHTTKQEYTRVYVGKKGEVSALFREFPAEVVLDAKSDFIETGIAHGCKTLEDFDTFFDTIRQPPEQLPNGQKIAELDDAEIKKETEKAEGDGGLKGAIQQHCLRLRGNWDRRAKSETALKHDAALIRVVEQLRKRNPKIWVLSLDRGLRACAAERAGTHAIPAVFILDGLIQILAVHGGGPNRSAEDFAPLLTSILLNRCSPIVSSYNGSAPAYVPTSHATPLAQVLGAFTPTNSSQAQAIQNVISAFSH